MKQNYNEVKVKDNMKVETDSNNEEVVQEKKELKKLVNVQPKKVKRNLLSRFITGIIGPDGLPSIGAYVNEEIIKPAIKNVIYDSITSGLSRAMFNDTRPHRGGNFPRGNSAYRPATNYSNRYGAPNQEPERKVARSPRYGVEDYIIEDRFDASHVLTTLNEAADRYDNVSVADYYDLIGMPSNFTDNSYGWTIDSISRATIVPTRGGYIIKFPPVEVI